MWGRAGGPEGLPVLAAQHPGPGVWGGGGMSGVPSVLGRPQPAWEVPGRLREGGGGVGGRQGGGGGGHRAGRAGLLMQ